MLANGTSAIGFIGTDLVTEFQNLPIPLEGLEVELTPQASIALESGEATYYEVRIQTAHRTERFVVQLADSATPQELEALVGTAAIDPDTIVISVVVDDEPVDDSTTTAISSNWAYDHVAAADPHPGYVLEAAANIRAVTIESGNYTLLAADSVVVFTATATATLPAATGSGRTYRIVCRAGTLTVDAAGTETVKGATTAVLTAGEDLIITDTAAGVWE